MIKIIDDSSLEKDPVSKAILRTDLKMLEEARKKRKYLHKIQKDSERINNIECKLSKVEELLALILTKMEK